MIKRQEELIQNCQYSEVLSGAQVAGYKVKCMLAEPKGKRGRPEPAFSGDAGSPATSASRGTPLGHPHRHERHGSFSGSFHSGTFLPGDRSSALACQPLGCCSFTLEPSC